MKNNDYNINAVNDENDVYISVLNCLMTSSLLIVLWPVYAHCLNDKNNSQYITSSYDITNASQQNRTFY